MISKRAKSFVGFLLLIGLVGLAFLIGRNLPAQPSQTTVSPSQSLTTATPTSPVASVSSTVPLASDDELVVLASQGGTQQVVAIDKATKKRRVLFTDADEPLKIKQVGNLTANGKEVIALAGQTAEEFGSALVAIATDGSGQTTTLITPFSAPWPPMFSPDGQKITYVFFSNAEAAGGGFVLVVANRDGTNKRELLRDSAPITQPVFNASGDQIAFVRERAPRGSEIVTIPAGGGTATVRASYSDRVPYDLAWSADDHFFWVDGTGDQADLYALAPGATEPDKLTAPAGRESRPVGSADNQQLAFTSLTGRESTVMVYNRTMKTVDNLGQGTIAIGFRRRGGA